MTRPRIVLPLIFTSLILVGCGGEAGEEEAAPEGTSADTAAAAMSPRCNDPPYPGTTRPIVDIWVEADTIVADPDPVVRPLDGILGWRVHPAAQADEYGWKVEFENGDSPLPDTVYFDSTGGKVQDTVRENAECRRYKFSITVWRKSDSTLFKDPWVDIIP